MFNTAMGTLVTRDGEQALQVEPGPAGCAIHGPYQNVRPGRFRVEYPLALSAPADLPPGETCAAVEVTACYGTVCLAVRHLSSAEIAAGDCALELTLREYRTLEFRVHVYGVASLIAGTPRLIRVGDLVDDWPAADPRTDTNDPVELNRQIRAVLRLFRPMRAVGMKKVRLGNAGDGGYVCLDDFAGLDTALSLGINDDISWDLDAADRGLVIQQFDHTVDDPAPHDGRMVFHKRMIATEDGPDRAALASLVRAHDRGDARPNLMLKMDIEGHEWRALEAMDDALLGRFSQIVCELHCFEALGSVDWRRLIYDVAERLHRDYAVVHIHGNSCAGTSTVANVTYPNVIEVSFANRALYRFEETDELFPGPLDISCDPERPDIHLGAFRF